MPKSESKVLSLTKVDISKSFEEELVQSVMTSREFWRLNQLKKLGIKLNSNEKNALLQDACQRGDLQSIKMLLYLHARVNSVNEEGMSPLHLAFQEGHIDIGKFLIEKGASLLLKDKNNKTPLHYLCDRGQHKEALEIYKNHFKQQNPNLFNNFSDFNDSSLRVAIYQLVEECLPSLAMSLIDELEDINGIDGGKGETLIHSLLLCKNLNPEIFSYLKENGADFNIKNKEGKAPLHRACFKPADLPIIDLLVRAGASPEAQDDEGRTPFLLGGFLR